MTAREALEAAKARPGKVGARRKSFGQSVLAFRDGGPRPQAWVWQTKSGRLSTPALSVAFGDALADDWETVELDREEDEGDVDVQAT